MKHASSSLRPDVPKLPPDATEAEFDAWMEALPPCPEIRSIDEDDAEGEAASFAEFEAGGGIPHSIVAEWLKTWGTEEFHSFRDWYASRDG